MNGTIDAAFEILAKKITASVTPEEAMKFTQAMLNLAHTHATLEAVKKY